MNKIDQLIAQVEGRLGVSRLLGRRAIHELRDHLNDSVAGQLSRGVDPGEAEDNAVHQIGTLDQLVRSVIDTSGGLRMISFLKTHLLVTVAILAAPGLLLLGLSFLTFNFPCGQVTGEYMGDPYTYKLCGLGPLQSLRPLISELGIYGGSGWLKWTIHILALVGPLLASLLIIRSRLSIRRRQGAEDVLEIAFAVDRTHILALAATFSIFLTVVAYKAAG